MVGFVEPEVSCRRSKTQRPKKQHGIFDFENDFISCVEHLMESSQRNMWHFSLRNVDLCLFPLTTHLARNPESDSEKPVDQRLSQVIVTEYIFLRAIFSVGFATLFMAFFSYVQWIDPPLISIKDLQESHNWLAQVALLLATSAPFHGLFQRLSPFIGANKDITIGIHWIFLLNNMGFSHASCPKKV